MGLMGSSIAACLLAAGRTVAAIEADPANLKKASRQVQWLLEGLRKERLLRADPRKILRRLTVSKDYSALRQSDIVVECVTEDLNVKRDVIRKIEQVVAPHTIIGSNTSAIPPTQLQQGALHPERILGTHWAEPAHITRFIADVDRSLRNDLGYWITFAGPFRFMDLTGIPAYRAVMRDLLPDLDCSQQVPAMMERLVESGAQGVANAKGFYNYTPAQAKRWEVRFLKFSYDVRALARKYPEDDASFASATLAGVDKQREDRKQP